MKKIIYDNRYLFLFVGIAIVYFFNLFIDIMEIDAAQYSLISMEMSVTKSFLEVFQYGNDYLDKPPLLFWLSSTSYLVFGISNFAYKLPSVLVALLGIYSTYRFAKLWYSSEKAILASLILASTQAFFLFTNDIRTDTLLTGFVIFAVWQMSEFLKNGRILNLVFTAIGIALGMMSKGPIALIAVGTGYFFHFLIHKQWKNFFRWQWVLAGIIIVIVLLPMSYGLYTQFDLHPEKFVYGLEGPSGLKFFYWTQSFGRITGEIYWADESTFFYFFHTILWDLQPWALLFIPALIIKVKSLFKAENRNDDGVEYITLVGFVLVFLALSKSNFKLPHYIFIIFPFAAIILSDFIYNLQKTVRDKISRAQFGLMHLFWIMMPVYFIFFFPTLNPILPILMVIGYVIFWMSFKRLEGNERLFIPTLITAIFFNLLLATSFYPNLLSYQASSQAGRFMYENIEEGNSYIFTDKNMQGRMFSYDFSSKRMDKTVNIKTFDKLNKGATLFISDTGVEELRNKGVNFEIIKELENYKVTALSLPFMLKNKRMEEVKMRYIIVLK